MHVVPKYFFANTLIINVHNPADVSHGHQEALQISKLYLENQISGVLSYVFILRNISVMNAYKTSVEIAYP